ncbi:hypothetical protein ACTG9Q_12460 [Actinokineospora sp. 24-640]
MTSPHLRLSGAELAVLAGAVDPVALAAAEHSGRRVPGRLVPWRGADDLVLLDGQPAGGRCVLPSAELCAVRTAAMAVLAARVLVQPGVVTAAVLGLGLVARLSVSLMVSGLPGVSRVAVHPVGDAGCPVPLDVVRPLAGARVGWTIAPALADALFGATLVVVAAEAGWGATDRLPPGSTLVNTTGADLPDAVVDSVDQVFVDDTALIGAHRRRHFARPHPLAGPPVPGGPRPHRVAADFAQLISGDRRGRSHADDVLLVELLGTTRLDVGLANALYEAAVDHGLGVVLPR